MESALTNTSFSSGTISGETCTDKRILTEESSGRSNSSRFFSDQSNRMLETSKFFTSEQDCDDDEESFLYSTDQETPIVYSTGNAKYPKKHFRRILQRSSKVRRLSDPTEESHLLSHSPTSSFNIADEECQPPAQVSYRCYRFAFISSLLFFAILFLTAIVFTFQPLQNTNLVGLEITQRNLRLFEFNLKLQALNTNLIPVNLTSLDLDVFASRGIGSSLKDMNQELLAHVRHFNSSSSVAVAAASQSVSTHKVSVIEPANTLGRLIILTPPFVLKVRGKVWYTSPFELIHYSIPVCLYQVVGADGSETETISCL